MMLYRLLYCILGPRLYAIYPSQLHRGHGAGRTTSGSTRPLARLYQPNAVEAHTNRWISAGIYLSRACVAWYGAMIWVPIAYHNGFLHSLTTSAGIMWSIKAASVACAIIFTTLCMRGLARYFNSDYISFIDTVFRPPWSSHPVRALNHYDFDFTYAPVDFTSSKQSSMRQCSLSYVLPNYNQLMHELAGSIGIKDFLARVVTYLVCHTFGKHLLYPGTYNWIFHLMWNEFTKNRAKMVCELGGKRLKLRVSSTGNNIDCLVIDQRGRQGESGRGDHRDKLVICCEGNAGFYEMGLLNIPLEAGYSVFGWNYPGFICSSGLPYPHQIESSMEAIMEYVCGHLHYKPEDIVFYAWSIGGYIAAWAGHHYPQCHSIILDATFDDLYPLAIDRMPHFFQGIVKRAVTSYLSLNVSRELVRYDGGVKLIRRSKDDIISTSDPPHVSCNRANHLLLSLMLHRYPALFGFEASERAGVLVVLERWLAMSGSRRVAVYHEVMGEHEGLCAAIIRDYLLQGGEMVSHGHKHYPCTLGDGLDAEVLPALALYLADKYLVEYTGASHDQPLPANMFVLPWTETTQHTP